MKSLLGLITFICFFTAIVAQKSPRTHEKFDQNWKFAFGHAAQPEKDFNYGIETVYSKSGGAQNTAIDPDSMIHCGEILIYHTIGPWNCHLSMMKRST